MYLTLYPFRLRPKAAVRKNVLGLVNLKMMDESRPPQLSEILVLCPIQISRLQMTSSLTLDDPLSKNMFRVLQRKNKPSFPFLLALCPTSLSVFWELECGLYTALILQSLNVSYEIIEASNRTGGRMFTHKFSDGGFFDYFVRFNYYFDGI